MISETDIILWKGWDLDEVVILIPALSDAPFNYEILGRNGLRRYNRFTVDGVLWEGGFSSGGASKFIPLVVWGNK